MALKSGGKERKLASYSNRNASVGLTAEARRAGMSAAPNVAEHKIKVAMAIDAGSVGLMSYSCDSIRRPRDARQGDGDSHGDHHQSITEHQPDGGKPRGP